MSPLEAGLPGCWWKECLAEDAEERDCGGGEVGEEGGDVAEEDGGEHAVPQEEGKGPESEVAGDGGREVSRDLKTWCTLPTLSLPLWRALKAFVSDA